MRVRYRQPLRHSLLLVGLFLAATVTHAASKIEFNRDIRPILSNNCFHCHGPDEATRKSGLRLDTEEAAKGQGQSGAIIAPGDPAASELIRRINHPDSEERMPPEDSKKRLTTEQKATLAQWIQEGAHWDDHWAFRPPVRPELPTPELKRWPITEIDHFILARLENEGLQPAPPANPETLIRRLSLDLNGIPPTQAEIDSFLADNRSDAYDRLVDRLLKSPRYGEHMAWQWLDAARYADTDGYQNDGPREMWRWRDWVIHAYNSNLPFDQFTIEQLAGDLLPNASTDQVIATGFNRNHRYNSESGLVFEEFLLENAVDRVDTTATVWMGLTLGCARCHDHKYDPFSQKEYYQLIAYFNSIPESGRAIKFGNSEPWVKAPTRHQQSILQSHRIKKSAAQDALKKAANSIAEEQTRWEAQFKSTASTPPVLPRGLDHHFANAEPIVADGNTGHELEQIANLICNGRFSIAFHMTPKQVNQGAILSNEAKGTGRNGILIEFNNGHFRFHIISRWIAGVATLETIQTFEPDRSVHIAVTNDGTQRSKGMRIYVNGERAQTRTLHNSNSNKSGAKFGDVMRVGMSPHIPSWEGSIRDLRFYPKRTLHPDEVSILAEPTPIAELVALAAPDRSPQQAQKLTHYFLTHAAPAPLARLQQDLDLARKTYTKYFDSLPTTMVMEETPQLKPTSVRIRGVYHQKGAIVERDVPATLPPMPANYPKSRLGFARWLVNGKHPLTARVTVNRFWQQLFGQGLVKTPEDFGAQGSLPSHPQLLDWLAVEFVENGWDTHQLLKNLVTSATYRQSSSRSNASLTQDPENILLSRMPRRRLPGNILRDQALFLSGLLVEKEGGPSVKPFQPKKLWSEASNFTYQMGKGSDLYRRSLYTYWKRTLAPPTMALLDTADREWCSVRQKRTNTPLQALTLLNEQAFFEAAKSFGRRIHQFEGSLQDKLANAFRATTARRPSPQESAVLKQSFLSYQQSFAADADATQQITHSTDAASATELAAWTALANMLLNLDETNTRE